MKFSTAQKDPNPNPEQTQSKQALTKQQKEKEQMKKELLEQDYFEIDLIFDKMEGEAAMKERTKNKYKDLLTEQEIAEIKQELPTDSTYEIMEI